MTFFFANPWGLLALAGLPAVLVIHLLRRTSQKRVVSTLFLVDRLRPVNEGGRRFRRLRQSLPLWIQLAAVLMVSVLLAQPRWISALATQTVVAVVDDSASMNAFSAAFLPVIRQELDRLAKEAAHSQWIILSSGGNRLASGDRLKDVLAQFETAWHPLRTGHDPGEAFRLGRVLAGEKGVVLYFTDNPPAEGALPEGVEWVAAGRRLANAGFLGAEADQAGWRALLRNFDGQPRTVRWKIEGESVWRELPLGPNAAGEVAGDFPENDRVTLQLEEDAFSVDNFLPIIRPQPKTLTIRSEGSPAFDALFSRLTTLAGDPRNDAASSEANPDVTLAVYDALAPRLPEGNAIVFVQDSTPPGDIIAEPPVAENVTLMENLTWQGLQVRKGLGVPVRDGDQVLLWQGAEPLIFLRTTSPGRQLIFNFDLRHSNADRLPAFPLLIHRFLARIRRDKPVFEAANVEVNQWLQPAGARAQNAPAEAGFFTITNDAGNVLFEGAAQFSDARESDFSAAGTGRSEFASWKAERKRRAVGALLDPFWAALLAGLMMANWALTGGSLRVSRPSKTAPRSLRPGKVDS